jgi:solute carrier family 25 citrate transporter 1
LYKGLGAVMTGIVPKMAIRFTSYEWYKQILADKEGQVNSKSTFAGMSISSAELPILHGLGEFRGSHEDVHSH